MPRDSVHAPRRLAAGPARTPEAEPHDSERAFQSLVENVSIGVYRTTPDGRVIVANSALLSMLGYGSFEELAPRNLESGIEAPYSRAEFRERLEREGSIRGLEGEWRRRDGSVLVARESARVVRDAEGRAIFYEGTVEDVTERKRVEAALSESEERFRTLSDAAFEGIAIHADGKIIEANAAFGRIFGYSRDEIAGLTAFDLIAPESHGELRAHLESHSDEPYELVGRRRDGTPFPMETNARSTLYRGAQVRVTAVRDLTTRRRAEDALRSSEEQWRSLVSNAPLVVAKFSIGGRILFTNRALNGLAPSDVEGRLVEEALPPAVAARLMQALREVVENGRSRSLELEFGGADGPTRALETTIGPMIEQGRVVAVLALIADVTARRASERHERQLAAIVASTDDAIVGESALGILTSWNPGAERLYGWSSAEILGRSVSMLIPDDLQREEFEMRQRVVETGVTSRLETRRRRKDGSLVDVSVTISPIADDQGVLIGLSAIARDITARVELERQAASQREAMARADRLSALGTLVAGVAHEINNPLMYVSGNIELALLDLAEAAAAPGFAFPGYPSVRRNLESALEGAERIGRITKALKSVARRGTSERSIVNLVDVVESVGSLVRVGVPDEVTLRIVAPAQAVLVNANASEIHQVVLNLTKNAIEAIGARAGNVELRVQVENGRAEIRVTDDGPGVPAELRASLFNPFFTTKSNGTGLGLSIVDSIAREHGGDVRLESEAGSGARFVVRLPLVEKAESRE